MAYNRVNWQNSPSHATPLSAENLNVMDEGIYDLDATVTEATGDIATLETTVSGHTTDITDLKEDFDELSYKVEIQNVDLKTGLYRTTDGGFDKNRTDYNCAGPILVYEGNTLTVSKGSSGATRVYVIKFDSSDSFVGFNEITLSSTDYVYTIPSGTGYVRFDYAFGRTVLSTDVMPTITLTQNQFYNEKMPIILERLNEVNSSEYDYEMEYDGNRLQTAVNYYKYNAKTQVPEISGYGRQSCAVYGNTMFVFYDTGMIGAYDYTSLRKIGSFSCAIGHGNTACFTDIFYDESDDFPLAIVGDFEADANTAYVVRLTTSSGTIVNTITFDINDCGHYCGYTYHDGILYILGYYGTTSGEWYQNATSTKISRYSFDAYNATPTLIDSFTVDYQPYRQDVSCNGKYIVFGSGIGTTEFPNKLVFVNPQTQVTENVVTALPPTLVSEIEAVNIFDDGRLAVFNISGVNFEMLFQ